MISSEKAFDILPFVADIYYKIEIERHLKDYQSKNDKNLDLENLKLFEGLNIFAFILKNSSKFKDEFFNIVAIIEDKELAEVKAQSPTATLKSIKELFANKELTDFFKEAMQ